ncbi:MAG: DHH family phosphoesterase, partial [Anaerolineae bacterium]|nr:DHH family phosphoesterase [Anaerolineae bacterium]
MTQEWREPEAVSVPRALRAATGGHPLVAETLVRRGKPTVAEAQAFLDADLYVPAAPEAMPGMADAVTRIQQALDGHERILVWGDFDVDGQTSTTLLVSCFRDLGGDVAYHIPVRDTESHGMRVPWLAQELAQGIDLVVTCDTGIDAHEAVAYAHSRGVDVIITDHHELMPTLPE